MRYDAPKVTDLGTLTDLTLAIGLTGPEDGASKMVAMHHSEIPISSPVGG
jgi:hypothetical protein